MNNLKKNLIILFVFFNALAYSQNIEGTKSYAEIVIIQDENLLKKIDSIMKRNQDCIKKGINWYVDFSKNNLIILSKGRIENLIPTHKNLRTGITLVNNEIVFVFFDEKDYFLFKKTIYSVDLSQFNDDFEISFEDFSFWILRKTYNNFEVIKEKKFKCDN